MKYWIGTFIGFFGILIIFSFYKLSGYQFASTVGSLEFEKPYSSSKEEGSITFSSVIPEASQKFIKPVKVSQTKKQKYEYWLSQIEELFPGIPDIREMLNECVFEDHSPCSGNLIAHLNYLIDELKEKEEDTVMQEGLVLELRLFDCDRGESKIGEEREIYSQSCSFEPGFTAFQEIWDKAKLGLKKLCSSSYTRPCVEYASMIEIDDPQLASELNLSACRLGDSSACYNYGKQFGRGMQQRGEYLVKACELGATYSCGEVLNLKEKGIPLSLYRRAATLVIVGCFNGDLDFCEETSSSPLIREISLAKRLMIYDKLCKSQYTYDACYGYFIEKSRYQKDLKGASKYLEKRCEEFFHGLTPDIMKSVTSGFGIGLSNGMNYTEERIKDFEKLCQILD